MERILMCDWKFHDFFSNMERIEFIYIQAQLESPQKYVIENFMIFLVTWDGF